MATAVSPLRREPPSRIWPRARPAWFHSPTKPRTSLERRPISRPAPSRSPARMMPRSLRPHGAVTEVRRPRRSPSRAPTSTATTCHHRLSTPSPRHRRPGPSRSVMMARLFSIRAPISISCPGPEHDRDLHLYRPDSDDAVSVLATVTVTITGDTVVPVSDHCPIPPPAVLAIYTYIGGTKNDDTIRSSTINNNHRIEGFDGNDVLFGENLADLIEGGDSNDRIDGGGGSDVILAGAGRGSMAARVRWRRCWRRQRHRRRRRFERPSAWR